MNEDNYFFDKPPDGQEPESILDVSQAKTKPRKSALGTIPLEGFAPFAVTLEVENDASGNGRVTIFLAIEDPTDYGSPGTQPVPVYDNVIEIDLSSLIPPEKLRFAADAKKRRIAAFLPGS